jgi:hypothetical protein
MLALRTKPCQTIIESLGFIDGSHLETHNETSRIQAVHDPTDLFTAQGMIPRPVLHRQPTVLQGTNGGDSRI